MEKNVKLTKKEIKNWWSKKRFEYNVGLVISGIVAFILYAFLGIILIAPYEIEFEITLFTIVFQGLGYLFMILIANLFFSLGYFYDKNYNTENSEKYRERLFSLGFWFSNSIPFLVPLIIIIIYFLNYYKF